MRKDFINDTGSPITIMLSGQKKLNQPRYKKSQIDIKTSIKVPGKKFKVKFRGKISVDVEYENNKQKMEILITERTDVTPLL